MFIKMQNMQNKSKKTKRISPDVVAIVGTLLTLIGGFFLSYNYVESKRLLTYDYMSNIFYKKEDKEIIVKDNVDIKEEETKEEANAQVTDEYIGYLTIPKINLTKGFVDMKSSENDVEKNIFIVAGSTMPDVEKGNLIIAGHSGSGWKAFFNDLYKLVTGDIAHITYNNKKYIYKITNIYKQPKTGRIAIYRNYDKTVLTLVTCTNNDDTTQTVYIAELQSVT